MAVTSGGAVRAWDEGNHQIALSWRALLEAPFSWRRATLQAGALDRLVEGEAGGFFVAIDSLGRRAYLKPRRKANADWAKAAREKIAADLAFELGVAVPPVVLATRDVSDEERNVCLSLVMFSRQFSWCEVKGWANAAAASPTAKLFQAVAPIAASRAFVFDTWLDQTDHGGEPVTGLGASFEGHDHNLMLGYDDPASLQRSLIFVDYAFSLGAGGHWATGGAGKVTPARFPQKLLHRLDRLELQATVERLEALDGARVREIVSRIPFTFLNKELGEVIADGLIQRQQLVRAALQPYLQEGKS